MKVNYKWIRSLLNGVLAVILAFVISGIVIFLVGYNPVQAFVELFAGSVGGTAAFGESLVKTVPLIFTGLSFAVAIRAGLVNLGASGQLYAGALMGTVVGVYLQGIPSFLHIFLALAAGAVSGALYGGLVSLLKSRFHANEIITTIMLNEIAVQFVNCMVDGPLKDMDAISKYPQSRTVAASAVLPRLSATGRLHIGFIIALLAIVFYAFFMNKTKAGYEIKVTGASRSVAECVGIQVKKVQLTAMLLAGAFAGLAGSIEILAIQKRLLQSFAGNIGFDGIAVALLGENNPVGILISSVLFGVMSNGSNKMQMLSQVPSAVIYLMQGFIILFVVGRRMYEKLFRCKKISKNSITD